MNLDSIYTPVFHDCVIIERERQRKRERERERRDVVEKCERGMERKTEHNMGKCDLIKYVCDWPLIDKCSRHRRNVENMADNLTHLR